MNKEFFLERDGMKHRLLLLLREHFELPFIRIRSIKKRVWQVSTKTQHWILKEFPTLFLFKRQALFTEELRSSGFKYTYNMHPKPFIFSERIFALIPFIEGKSGGSVSYHNKTDIKDVISLLQNYHQATTNISLDVKKQIPGFDQMIKWRKRLNEFKQSIQLYRPHPFHPHLSYFADIGEWALLKLQSHADFFTEEPHSVIHGDVASHNFIKDKHNQLWLIDFDLISLAPDHIDYLQLANRILPHLNWNLEHLFTFKELQSHQTKEAFLIALIYPTDIYREWLHYTKMRSIDQTSRGKFIETLLLKQFKQRVKFTKEIMREFAG